MLKYIKKQEEVYLAVTSHRAEIESRMQQNRIMAEELETVKKQKDALQVQLEEAEERSSVIREKLTMAVKKGKLSSELKHFESLETDVISLKNHCADIEKELLDNNGTTQSIMEMLNSIDFTGEFLS